MKPAQAVTTFLAIVRNWRYVRFPTLTRPMIDPAPLPVRIGSHEADLDDAFLMRVQACYQRATAQAAASDGAIWQALEERNRPFLDALKGSDPSALRPFLETLYAGDLLMGMGHVQRFIQGRKTLYPRPYFAMRVRDALMSLSEALALRGPASNQQTPLAGYRDRLRADLTPLVAEIELTLGHPVNVPAIGCPPGAEIGGRLFNPDLIRHAYVPHRITELCIGPEDPVLEIGGGYGVVARYMVLRGHRAWTIVDLPYVNAIQMLWLGATLGPDKVSGHGERRGDVHLHPSTDKVGLEAPVALALNMDSLPEIAAEEANAYLDLICRKADRFLSINQEAQATPRGGDAQNSVPRMMDGRPMRRLFRHPYWMEQGYVEELYARWQT